MKKAIFTPEELEELEAFDAMIDEEPDWDPEEIKAARERDFQARQQGRDGREAAIAEYKRGYRAANKEAIAEYKRGYYAANKEAIAEYQRGYRAANKEAIAEYQRGYYAANKAAIAEYQRGYYAANKAAIAEYQRGYRAAGSDIRAEQSPLRQWRRDRHYSQATAARLLKVSQPTISNIERGIQPMPEAIQEAISR